MLGGVKGKRQQADGESYGARVMEDFGRKAKWYRKVWAR